MESKLPLCPYIRLAWYDVMQPGSDIPMRVIFDYELMYIKHGQALIVVEDAEGQHSYNGTAGDLFFFRPRQRHSISILGDAPLTQPHIHFDLTYSEDREQVPVSLIDLPQMTEEEKRFFRSDVTGNFFEHFPTLIRLQYPAYFEQLFFDLIFVFHHPGHFQEVHLQALFLQLWYLLLSDIRFKTKPKEARHMEMDMYTVYLYIMRNLDRRISLDELCSIVYYNKCYLLRAFQKVYRLTPHQYHAYLRFEKARDMVCYTGMPIQTISARLGFSSLQDFSRFFRRMCGYAPSALRTDDAIRELVGTHSLLPESARLHRPMELDHNIHLTVASSSLGATG